MGRTPSIRRGGGTPQKVQFFLPALCAEICSCIFDKNLPKKCPKWYFRPCREIKVFWSPTLCHNSGNFLIPNPGINPTPGGGLHPPVKEDFPTLGVMWHAKTLKIRQNPQIDIFNCSGHFHCIWDIMFAQKWSKFGTERGTEKNDPGWGAA